ncbi:Rieske 2Fe-2S domain-containing protein [Agrococcus versicolor]
MTEESKMAEVEVHREAALQRADDFENPGLPPHRKRQTDLHPEKEKRAERVVFGWFLLSALGSIIAVAAYVAVPITPGDLTTTRFNNLFLGLGIALAMLAIGIGAVHWSKQLMSDEEHVELRHSTKGSEKTRAKAVEVFTLGDKESGFTRRSLIRNSLIGALAFAPLPAVVLFRDLAPADQVPTDVFAHTMWEAGTRLCLDPTGTPIRASDVSYGSAFHVMPEGIDEAEHPLDEKALAAVLVMRLPADQLNEAPDRAGWSYDGIVAYSKICTHVGCPVALYEQQTHHLLCPCHQSTFDVKNHCKVIFGPANRPLPQLPIAVDSEGYLIAQRDFTEPIGPSYFERLHDVDEDEHILVAGTTEDRA